MDRRKFGITSLAAAGTVITSQIVKPKQKKEMKNVFIHHVFFWLANPDSKTDLDKLVAGLKKLTACKSLKNYHIGVPASTSRDVIDGSYSISWYTSFATAKDQDDYQFDPIHLAFVETNKNLWNKVLVYDSIDL